MSTIERVIGEKKMPEIVMFVVRSNSIPVGMKPKPARKEPAERMEGTVIAQSEKNDVSLAALASLRIGDYRLVESYYEREWDLLVVPGKRTLKGYYALTYTFAREGDYDRGGMLGCCEMLLGSLWQVRVYKNPLFRNGVPVPGFTLSVNCINRKPLYNDDGSFLKVWNADRTEKVPLEPASYLEIDGDTVLFGLVE